jgi:hypothetical protein
MVWVALLPYINGFMSFHVSAREIAQNPDDQQLRNYETSNWQQPVFTMEQG